MRIGGFWVLVLWLAAPMAGDTLVLHDGTRIETSGPWKVKGRQVIYTGSSGSLSTLRVADVDLETSRVATAERDVPQPAAPQPMTAVIEVPRVRAMVLTNKDIPTVADEAAEESSEAEEESNGSESQEPVELVTWTSRESPDLDGLEIFGTVRNTGDGLAAAIAVEVSVSDENGDPLLETRAFLQRSSLLSGQSSTFRALLPGVYTLFEDPRFTLSSDAYSIQGAGRDDDESKEDEFPSESEEALERESLAGG